MPEYIKGLKKQGNVGDLADRPRVKNADGSVSTVRSMSFNEGKGEVLIPTANDGLVYSDEDAIQRYGATGEHLGIFDTPENATAYAERLHKDQEAQTADGAQVRKEQPRETPRRASVDEVKRAVANVRTAPAARNDISAQSQLEDDDKVRRVLQHIFKPDWGDELGTKAGQVVREKIGEPMRERASSAARKYVEWVQQERANPLPGAAQKPAKKAMDWYNEGAHPYAKQDAELETLRLQKEAAKRQIEEQSASDGGEIDAPAARTPVAFHRGPEMTEEQRQAYVETVRKAQQRVK